MYSEYSTLQVGAETDITVTLGEKAEAVSITAYRDSVKNGDTVQMSQKNEYEWKNRVYFEETGAFDVVATAVLADGRKIEGSIRIEVTR